MLLHQADWIAGNLHGKWQLSDYNNVLKLGYDPGLEEFPDWLSSQVLLSRQYFATRTISSINEQGGRQIMSLHFNNLTATT